MYQAFRPGKDRRNEEDSDHRLRGYGGAILSGCLAKGLWNKEDVYVKEHSEEASKAKAARYGVHASTDGSEAKEADLVLIAVKPNVVPEVLHEISRYQPSRVLSIAAAVTLESLENGLPKDTEVIRVMPNTPASVGEGMAAIAPGTKASPAFIREAEAVFSALGREAVVTERQLDELGALSGAGPGYALSLLMLWLMREFLSDCPGSWPSKRRPRPFTALQRWCWKRGNIPMNSGTR